MKAFCQIPGQTAMAETFVIAGEEIELDYQFAKLLNNLIWVATLASLNKNALRLT